MNKTADIVIVGGGVSGASIGYFLMKNGAKNVVLLEKDYLAAGATGRCGAGIRQQWGTELNCVMSKFACEFFENAVDELGYDGDIEFHQGGYLLLISAERELEQMRANIELQNRLGINARLLNLDEAREVVPYLNTEGLLACAFHQRDGHLNPFHTTQAFAEAFKRLGGQVETRTAVTGFTMSSGRITGVDTTNGHIQTNTVIDAAGGYSQAVAELAGIKLPLYSERHNILVTEPVEPLMGPMVMSFSLNLYCQQSPHGSFIMGRTDDNQPRDLRTTAFGGFPEVMAKTVTGLLPPLKKLRMLRQWAGLYNMSPDKAAIYDKSPGVDGFYIAAGFSGHGFMMSPATGQSMAELVLGMTPTLPWKRMGLSRFETGELLLEPSVV